MPDKRSSSFPKIRASGSFCVNVLAQDQEAACRAFASKGGDKYAESSWHPAGSGSPILDGAVAWIDCDIDRVLEAGDHYIVLGRVRDLDVAADEPPLLFFRGGYGRFSSASLAAPAEPDLLGHLRVMDKARPQMERLAAELDLECLAVTTVGDEVVTLSSAGRSFGGPVDRIGQRMPFVPPLCGLFVAWAGSAAVQRWLDRLGPGLDVEEAQRYREMIDRIRRRGWSIALGTRSQIAFELALAELGEDPSEERQRAVQEAARRVGPGSHEPDDAALATDRPLNVRNVSAPVFDAEGDAVLMLTLIGFPKSLSIAEVERPRDRLLAAAQETTSALRGRVPDIAADTP